MIIVLFCFLIPIIYISIKLILFYIVCKFGKFTYDGFHAAGFAYNKENNLFYSTRNAWQKNFGYTHLYDVGAPIFRMIIDTEPVRFSYNNKNWLLTFWKGQYGIVTGAEIGIYVTDDKKVNKRTLYLPVEDKDMLNMGFILYKNGVEITRVKARHWWLAVFKLGMFSKPKELSMDVQIEFPNREMLEAFLISFKKMGYKSKDYLINGNIFRFIFRKPRTRKVWTRCRIGDAIRQYWNHKNVKLYNKYLSDVIDINNNDDNIDKKLIKIDNMIPSFLKNSKEDLNASNNYKNVVFLDDNIYSNVRINRL